MTLISCPACGAAVGRRALSDFWRCDNEHTIYRGVEPKPARFELRRIPDEKLSYYQLGDVLTGILDRWSVWDLLTDEPFYDPASDKYAWLIDEGRARSLLARLLE